MKLARIITCCLWIGLVWSADVKQQGIPDCSWCRRLDRCPLHLPADKRLSPEERKKMESAIQILLNRKQKTEGRIKAARILGGIAHSEAIEPLKRVAFDRTEKREVRYWAVTALSQIADKRVIPILIDLSLDHEVGSRAAEQLWKLTDLRLPPGIEPMGKGEKRKDWLARIGKKYHKAWMDWWEKNKDAFVLDRARALLEF